MGYTIRTPEETPARCVLRGPKLTLYSLLAWYTLYTVLFRCPTSLLSSSPVVCHGYHSVHNFLTPHLQPYYDSYAADYVTTFTPYVSHTNEAYIYPFLDKASVGYEKYAQPAIAKAKLIAEHQYQRNLHPHVSKALAQLNATYEQYLAAYFNTVHRLYTNLATSPFWTKTRAYVDGFYRRYLLPGYERVSPYLNKAKEKGKHVVVVYLSPYVKEGARVSGVWFEKNVGSGIRGIWKEYVQVQMRRIRDRLKTGGHTGNGYVSLG